MWHLPACGMVLQSRENIRESGLRIDELLPWNWKRLRQQQAAA